MKVIQGALYIFVLLSAIVSIWVSIELRDFSWFSRAGSIISIVPVLISIIEIDSDRKAMFYAKHNYGVITPNNVEELAQKYWPIKLLMNSAITIVGTIVWGFGDLLGKFF